jgi:hypothetical protein
LHIADENSDQRFDDEGNGVKMTWPGYYAFGG